MTLQAGEKLMSLTDVSEMLGIPVHTLYRWRHNGDGPAGYVNGQVEVPAGGQVNVATLSGVG